MTMYSTDPNPHSDRVPPQPTAVSAQDDIRTVVLNQISWGAVFGGAMMALVTQVILNMVGVGVGLATIDPVAGDSPTAASISMGAGLWWIVSGIVAAAIGGYLAGRLSGKPSNSTTAYHGLMSWALSTLVIIYLLTSAATGLFGGRWPPSRRLSEVRAKPLVALFRPWPRLQLQR